MHRLAVSFVVILAACAAPADEGEVSSAPLTTAQREGIVGAVNCTCTTFESLRDAGVISRAATNLMERRNGPDGLYPTADDRPFETFDEVYAVPQVGPVTVQRLLEYAIALGFVDPDDDAVIGVWDDVPFTAQEAATTLRVANTATFEELDGDAGLRSNVARNLVDARPIADMDALAAVPYLGPVAMAALKDYALAQEPPARPDLNTAGAAELTQCAYVGPATASAIIDYRERFGRFETYEEVRALPAFGYPLSVSDHTVNGLRACVDIAGGRPRAGAVSVAALLANPAAHDGAVVELPQVVMTANLANAGATTLALFDFDEWGYADWNAAGVSPTRHVRLIVDAQPEMYRRASTSYEARYSWDTRLNLVNVVGVFERAGGVPTVRVRTIVAPGRDYIQVDQRWLAADRVASLAALWSRENGVLRGTDGFQVNRIATALLDVHPAILWHTAQTGEEIRIGSTTGCTYDCSVSRFTDGGDGLYRVYVDAWRAAGRP
jgi:competence ComEA-like helix-hairpin-helix protein